MEQNNFGITNNYTKVVWLCHFANEEINNYFGTNTKEFAPWMSELIKLFENNEIIELHIVAPNVFNNKNHSFTLGGIHYHFFKFSPFWFDFRYFEIYRIGYFTGFYHSSKYATKIIEDINPDLIHLHGAENPYYSSVILKYFSQYPCFTTIQGFAKNTKKRKFVFNYFRKRRCAIENTIIEKSKYIGVRTDEMAEELKSINPNAKLCWHNYPINIPVLKDYESNEKEYDIAFYARVCQDKGIEDLLVALQLIKYKLKTITLVIIGFGSPGYIQHLKQKVKDLNLSENVTFAGFQQKQEDAYKILSACKLYVLPTYHDIIPGTLIEAMFLMIPSITYSVGGIPSLNKEREAVVLVEKGNIEQLADSITQVLVNKAYATTLSENGYLAVATRFNNDLICPELIKFYERCLQGQ